MIPRVVALPVETVWCAACAAEVPAPHEAEQDPSVAAPQGSALATREAPQLPTIEHVKLLLAACVTVDEAAELRDQSRAVEAYYQQRADSLEIQNYAAEVRLRAERRIGELLARRPKNKGGRPSKETGTSEVPVIPTLDSIGITRNQASLWQRIAALAEDVFEDRVATAQENGLELTTYRVLHEAQDVAKAAERAEAEKPTAAPSQPRPAEKLEPLDLRKLARRILTEKARPEILSFVAILTHGEARDEREAREAAQAAEDVE